MQLERLPKRRKIPKEKIHEKCDKTLANRTIVFYNEVKKMKVRKKAMKKTKNMYLNESVEARELYIYCENDHDIYKKSILPAVENLKKKYKKGIYDPEKAIDLYYYAACEGSKSYKKYFGYSFTVNERYNAAIMLEASLFDLVSEVKENEVL